MERQVRLENLRGRSRVTAAELEAAPTQTPQPIKSPPPNPPLPLEPRSPDTNYARNETNRASPRYSSLRYTNSTNYTKTVCVANANTSHS